MVLAQAAINDVKLSDAERLRAVAALEESKLVRRKRGSHEVDESYLRALLRAPDGRPERQGLDRFLVDGRIDRYPANLAQRRDLLRWIAKEVLEPSEVLDEPAFNGRLEKYADDVAVLRRYLVDAGLVERTRSGTAYALAQAPSPDGSA